MEGYSAWHWLMVLVGIIIPFIPYIFYILSFRKTAQVINAAGGSAPRNSAWILLVPLLGFIWFFVLLFQLRDAIKKTGKTPENNQWWVFGIIAGCLSLVGILTAAFGVGLLVLIGWVVFSILHWIKIVQLRETFQQN